MVGVVPFIIVLFSLSCQASFHRTDISAVKKFQSIRSSAFAAMDQSVPSSSEAGGGRRRRSNDKKNSNSPFPRVDGPPFLAVITEENACDSDLELEKTLNTLKIATSTYMVDLISIRVKREVQNILDIEEDGQGQVVTAAIPREQQVQRVVALTRELINWSKESKSPFQVVLSSDWMDVAVQSGAHGVHFKESHRQSIGDIRQQYKEHNLPPPLVGTSAHSVDSAKHAWEAYRPNYFFVGTCYATLSHPEKVEMEGPALPGQVVEEFVDGSVITGNVSGRPVIFAIGGINSSTCHDPVVKYGADGVAVIRSVMQADDPAAAVRLIQQRMQDS